MGERTSCRRDPQQYPRLIASSGPRNCRRAGWRWNCSWKRWHGSWGRGGRGVAACWAAVRGWQVDRCWLLLQALPIGQHVRLCGMCARVCVRRKPVAAFLDESQHQAEGKGAEGRCRGRVTEAIVVVDQALLLRRHCAPRCPDAGLSTHEWTPQLCWDRPRGSAERHTTCRSWALLTSLIDSEPVGGGVGRGKDGGGTAGLRCGGGIDAHEAIVYNVDGTTMALLDVSRRRPLLRVREQQMEVWTTSPQERHRLLGSSPRQPSSAGSPTPTPASPYVRWPCSPCSPDDG